jgi:hypothetical protein
MSDEKDATASQPLNYRANSQKSQQPEPEEAPRVVGPVVSGIAVERKESVRKKFLSAYAGDSAQSVGHYLLNDVVVPATKNLVSDLVTQGINRLLYGTTHRPNQGGIVGSVVGSRMTGVGYGKFFNGGASTQQSQQQAQPQMSAQARATHSFNEIYFPTRSDGEIVLEELRNLIEKYGNAKVVDFYLLSGITSAFTDQKYGWTNLSRASVMQTRQGYVIDMPRPEVLN